LPRTGFFGARHRTLDVQSVVEAGWLNVYRYFSEVNIWPRGLPLDMIQRAVPEFEQLPKKRVDCPIQQGWLTRTRMSMQFIG